MKFEVQPIVRELDLGEYDAIYQGHSLQVWVNAPAEFLRQRDELLVEYSRHWKELSRLRLQAVRDGGQRFQLTKVLPWKQPAAPSAPGADEALAEAFNAWVRGSFLPAIHGWFAELLSKGPEDTRWTGAELDEVFRRDSVLIEWIKRRSLEMVQAYAEEKKRNFEPPSST